MGAFPACDGGRVKEGAHRGAIAKRQARIADDSTAAFVPASGRPNRSKMSRSVN